VPDAIRFALAIAGKDIRAELRSKTALLSALVFAALVLVVFNFARDPTVLAASDLAPQQSSRVMACPIHLTAKIATLASESRSSPNRQIDYLTTFVRRGYFTLCMKSRIMPRSMATFAN